MVVAAPWIREPQVSGQKKTSLTAHPWQYWLEDSPFLLRFGNFSGENSLLNFGKVCKTSKDLKLNYPLGKLTSKWDTVSPYFKQETHLQSGSIFHCYCWWFRHPMFYRTSYTTCAAFLNHQQCNSMLVYQSLVVFWRGFISTKTPRRLCFLLHATLYHGLRCWEFKTPSAAKNTVLALKTVIRKKWMVVISRKQNSVGKCFFWAAHLRTL